MWKENQPFSTDREFLRKYPVFFRLSDRANTKKNQGFVKLKQVERRRGTISEMDQLETSIHNQIHRGKLEKLYNTEVWEQEKKKGEAEARRGKERPWADTVGNRSDRSIDQSIWGLLKSTTMSVFTYSRTSICQDVAGLVNKVAVFVVLDGGRSWALHMGRWNRYQRRVPTEDPISGVECTVWLVRITLVGPTIGPRVFGFMTKSADREPISPAVRWSTIHQLVGPEKA